MTDNKRYRTFNLLLYPDNEKHLKAIERLKTDEFKSVGILHNCDVTADGELKKEHYHFIVKFVNNRTKSALAKDLDIEERFIDTTVNFNSSGKYLLHIGHPDKYQYDVDDLVGNLTANVIKLIDDTTEDFKAVCIIDLLNDFDYYVTLSDLLRICSKKGLYSVLRRNSYYFIRVLEEHNLKYKKIE